MVYCGPPSKGCSNCRDRKIRCDQKEPGCGQCEKRKQSCPGYRNMVDLMFRDQSSQVIKKAKSKPKRRIASTRTPETLPFPANASASSSSTTPAATIPAREPRSAFPNTPTPRSTPTGEAREAILTFRSPRTPSDGLYGHREEASPAPSSTLLLSPDLYQMPEMMLPPEFRLEQEREQQLQQQQEPHDDSFAFLYGAGSSRQRAPSFAHIYSLEPNHQECGTAFFFSRYVTVEDNAVHHRFDFLYDIWKPSALANEQQADAVLASMAAVGLVGISQLTHSEDIIDSARKSYGTALRLTNAALLMPEEAAKDTTMLSVLLLGVFEMLGQPGLKTMQTWQNHINGAVELAKLRGPSQFGTRAGVRMFSMLCESVAISCMQRQVPMPPELVALKSEMLRSCAVPDGDPAGCGGLDLGKPIYKVLQARCDMLNTDVLDRLDDLLAQLADIEAEFDRTIAGFPPEASYNIVHVTKAHKAVFRDCCHAYPSVATASAWNVLRASRILVLETILSAVQRHYPETGDSGELVPLPYLVACHRAWAEIGRVNMAIVASVPQHFGLLNPVHPAFHALQPTTAVGISPLSTTEVREPPTPSAQSPRSSTGSVQTPAGGYGDDVVLDDGGPSLENPTRGRTAGEAAERYIVLASATNAVVWPLFVVGMSSVCGATLKAYVLTRLDAIFEETGLVQARTVASLVRQRQRTKAPWLALLQRSSSQSSDGSRNRLA